MFILKEGTMGLKHWKSCFVLPLVAAFAIVLAGCGKDGGGGAKVDPKGGKGSPAQDKGTETADKKGHDHSAWWCAEHGIPEEMCSMCSAKVAAECKKKGDWCDKHDRAKSQCFICDASLKEKFAAMYRAKYGKEPPPIEEEKKDEGKKDEKKDEKKEGGKKDDK
jgi:hypothetical protein